jgi:signal transduction histidine kinase
VERASKRVGRRATIKARVLAVVAVPSAAILIIGACLFGYLLNDGLRASDFAQDVRAALGPTTRFVAAAEEERRLTLQMLAAPGGSRVDLDDQRRQVDGALADMSTATAHLATHTSGHMSASLADFQRAADGLHDTRQRVDTGRISAEDAYAYYKDLLGRCGATIQDIARSSSDGQVAFAQVVSYDLFNAAEAMSQAHVMAVYAVTNGLDPDQLHELVHQLGMYRQQLDELRPVMTPWEQASYAALTATPAWQQLDADDEFVMNHDDDFGPSHGHMRGMAVPFDPGQWQQDAHQVSQELMGLFASHASDAADLGAAHARRTLVTSVLVGIGILLVIAAVLLVALRLSARLIRRLTRLREETLNLADRQLPELMRRLRDGERVDLEHDVPWLDHGHDEIGQLANAFNTAQRSAISATVREAETREGVRAVFLNIAHRTQVIVHRQLKVLDQAERSLEDPTQLRLLFQLDHLATRGRRNAENLIILGGGTAGRQWRNPVPLREVVRSSIAEIEHYTRVDTMRLPEAAVGGVVVADLVHLLSELLDNATSFSPPRSVIEVRGNAVGHGAVVEIEDQGLGIEPERLEQLNAMLRNPPDFNVMALSEEPRIGLFVVARLAARHGIRVTLRESAYLGVRATVLIPSDVLAESAAPELPALDAGPSDRPAGSDRAEADRHAILFDAADGIAGPFGPSPTLARVATTGHGRAAHRAADGADNGNGTSNGHHVPADGTSRRNGTAESAETVSGNLAPLPRRVRGKNLADRLLTEETTGDDAETTAERTPEQTRSSMTAFQQGTLLGRAAEQDPAQAGDPRVEGDDDGHAQHR